MVMTMMTTNMFSGGALLKNSFFFSEGREKEKRNTRGYQMKDGEHPDVFFCALSRMKKCNILVKYCCTHFGYYFPHLHSPGKYLYCFVAFFPWFHAERAWFDWRHGTMHNNSAFMSREASERKSEKWKKWCEQFYKSINESGGLDICY